MRVVGFELELLNELSESDVVLAEPVASFAHDRLGVDVAYYRPVGVQIGREVLAFEVVDIVLDGMAEDDNGMVKILKAIRARDALDEEAILEDVTHLVEGDKACLTVPIACGTEGVWVRRL
jgi:hypothetical protein